MSPVPAAIDGLYGLWINAPELVYDVDGQPTQVDIVDGPPLDATDQRRTVYVGTGAALSAAFGDGGANAVRRPGYGGRRADSFDVRCGVFVTSGDTSVAAVRGDAYAVLEVLDALLVAQPALGGAVSWARITGHTYEPRQTDQGAAALITFTVRVDAVVFTEE